MRALGLAALVWVVVPPLFAQQNPSSRTIRGQVVGPDQKPAAEALVHLKNRKTDMLTTVVTDEDGRYEFVGLPMDTDFEVYAESRELRSVTKRVSRFDRRTRIFHNFELKKPEKEPSSAEKEKPPG